MEENIIKEENECFICLEVSSKYENKPSRFKNKIQFFKKCKCDGWVHDDCIEKWFYLKEICPICCNRIIYINSEFDYMLYFIHFYLYITKNVKIIINRLNFFLKIYVLYMIINYMFQIILTAKNKFNNYALENTCYNEEYMDYKLNNMDYKLNNIYYNYTCPQIL